VAASVGGSTLSPYLLHASGAWAYPTSSTFCSAWSDFSRAAASKVQSWTRAF